jgi:hypothetical protein
LGAVAENSREYFDFAQYKFLEWTRISLFLFAEIREIRGRKLPTALKSQEGDHPQVDCSEKLSFWAVQVTPNSVLAFRNG